MKFDFDLATEMLIAIRSAKNNGQSSFRGISIKYLGENEFLVNGNDNPEWTNGTVETLKELEKYS